MESEDVKPHASSNIREFAEVEELVLIWIIPSSTSYNISSKKQLKPHNL